MKKLLLLFLSISISVSAMAQLVGGNTYSINGTDNGTTSFASLRSAISYLQTNGVTGSGQVILEFASTYDPTLVDAPTSGATKITIPSISGTSSALGITIRPASGVTVALSANVDASGLIDLDGASYITIDGRPGGVGTTSGLTIESLSTTTAAATAAVRFVNDAHHNTLTYLTLKSATTHSSSQAATVLFHTSTGTLGNSNNTVSNNTLTVSAGSTRTAYAVVSYGSDIALNAENKIINNDISNYTFRAIYLYSSSTVGLGDAWTISGNSVFSSVTVTGTTSYGICVLGTGAGHTITDNYVGGQAPQCGGNAMQVFGFAGIYMTSSAFGATSLVQNNTIANISANYTGSSLTGNTSIHYLIYATGNVDILNNNLGSQTSTDNIILATSNAQAEYSVFATPIYIAGAGTVNIKNNLVGGITYNPTGTSVLGYYGRMIYVNSTSLASLTIENNTFGGSVANSIQNTGTGRGVYLQGIYTTAIGGPAYINNNIIRNFTGTTNVGISGIYFSGIIDAIVSGNTITNLTSTGAGTSATIAGITAAGTNSGISIKSNIISNLTTNGTNTGNTSSSVLTGISLGTAGATITATDNVIYNLTCTGAAATHVIGIGSFGGREIARNRIYNLFNPNATAAGTVKALVLRSSSTFNINNNIFALTNVDGNAAVYGIESNSATGQSNIYYNTILISGSALGANNSATIFRSAATPFDIKNNILFNTRSGGSGINVLLYATETTAAWTSDNNLYVTPSGSTAVGLWSTTSYDLAGWQSARSGDVSSASYTSATLDPTAFFADNLSPYFMSVQASYDSYFKAKGTPIAITTDIGNNIRNATTPSLGAYEANTATLLPVNIAAFTAKLNNNKVALNWAVGSENNVNRYEVERSSNGIDFVKVATVLANGSSNYTAVDASPSLGINYYRLRGVDNDGTISSFNELRTVKVTSLEAKEAIIYPNPLVGNTINVNLAGYAAGTYQYKLADVSGKVVQQGSFVNTGASSNIIVLSGTLAKGVYLLQVINGADAVQARLVKQ